MTSKNAAIVDHKASRSTINSRCCNDVASSICDACKEFDTNFLISSDLERKIQHTFRKQVDNGFQIRGRNDPIVF